MFNDASRRRATAIFLSLLSSGVLGASGPATANSLKGKKGFCDSDLSRWSSLISLRPVEPFSFPSAAWMPHPIEKAAGKKVNIDYYSAIVDALPPGMTADQLLRHIRVNLNQFVIVISNKR